MKNIVNIAQVAEISTVSGAHWASFDKTLTPALTPRIGRLGVVATRVEPGKSACPFHTHQCEDEVFFILSGRGLFRYGDEIQEVGPGDCISCPAGSGVAHQLANPFEADLIYLCVGMNDANEVCTYPDSGKIWLRSLNKIGWLDEQDYMAGEPELPRIFDLYNAREK
jgi:uncharacterized cupin superfamily protein